MSDVASEVARLEQLFVREGEVARTQLFALANSVLARPEGERLAAVDSFAARVNHPHPAVGATFALAAGAVVESGISPRALGEVIAAPLLRAAVAARPFVERAAAAPEATDSETSTYVGQRALSQATLDELVAADRGAASAFFSLDMWYRPAVAAWTRETATLRRLQDDGSLSAALAPLDGWCEGAHWLWLLLGSALDVPFVVILPEIGEAYALRLDGCSDMGQMSVLLSEPLAKALKRIGAPAVASKEMLAVMRGDGGQCATQLVFSAAFHAYPWQAMDPKSGLPEDKRFTWIAPGGAGDHSLPPDFQPRAIAPIDGTRVLLVVGPRSRGVRFVREIGGARMFDALRAKVDQVRQLSPAEAKQWTARVVEESDAARRRG
jgi:hypothetical protein